MSTQHDGAPSALPDCRSRKVGFATANQAPFKATQTDTPNAPLGFSRAWAR